MNNIMIGIFLTFCAFAPYASGADVSDTEIISKPVVMYFKEVAKIIKEQEGANYIKTTNKAEPKISIKATLSE